MLWDVNVGPNGICIYFYLQFLFEWVFKRLKFIFFKRIKFIFYTHLLIKTFIVKYNSLTCLTLFSPSLYLFFLIKFILIDEIILHLTHKIVADLNKSSPICYIKTQNERNNTHMKWNIKIFVSFWIYWRFSSQIS